MNEARRAVDYLENRDDIDRERLGYYGSSWGARMGSIVLALEPRLRAALFQAGGFLAGDAPPEADPVNFAPRVKVPVLMVNGSEDFIFDVELAQKPLFTLLGSPPNEKRHIVLPGGHGILAERRNQSIREALDWFDRYLGQVR